MNDSYLLAGSLGPDFTRDLIAMVVMLGLACLLAVWGTYKMLRKLDPNVKRLYHVPLAVIIVVVLVNLVGLVSQQLGL